MEAREWLAAHNVATPASVKSLTLSDLFAVAGSQGSIVNVAPLKRAGFIR
jgi:hypothetical protein